MPIADGPSTLFSDLSTGSVKTTPQKDCVFRDGTLDLFNELFHRPQSSQMAQVDR